MLLDSGIAVILKAALVSKRGEKPKTEYTEEHGRSYYGEKTVGIQRYWTAKGHQATVDAVIRVQRDAGIRTDYRCRLIPFDDSATGEIYRILQVQQVTDEDGNPATDLTLERIDGIEQA